MFRTVSSKITAMTLTVTMTIVTTLGAISYLFMRSSIEAQIQEKLSFEASIYQSKLEPILLTINQEVKNLSENLVLVNALIDSVGRDTYLAPFMKGYKLPIECPFTITLYNFVGEPVVSNQQTALSNADSSILQKVIGEQRPLVEIKKVSGEHNLFIMYPVFYSYTGLPEGVLILTVPLESLTEYAFSSLPTDPGSFLSLTGHGHELWSNHSEKMEHTFQSLVNLNMAPPLKEMELALILSHSMDNIKFPLTRLTLIYTILGIVIFLSTIFVSRYMAHRLTIPLQMLTEAADKIASSGIPNGQLDITSDDETQKLTLSFNTMLARLHDSQISLEKRVQARTAELELMNQKLQHYAESRNALLREVNHRVKNNLTAIISILHQEEDYSLARSANFFDYGERMREVVNRVSGLLTVHTMLSASQWEPLSLTHLCEKIINESFKGAKTNKSIRINISPSDISVNSDQAHYLAIVLNELATNSVKYALQNRDEATVQVSLNRQDELVLIVYRDDGSGYPQPILQGDVPSTSIGFNLMKGIVKKSMQGNIEFRNDNGAMTRITFPEMTES